MITSLISLKYENQLEYNGIFAIEIVVIAALVASDVYVAFSSIPTPPEDDVVLVVGTKYGPIDLDPQVAWDSASINVIDHVCEGLYAYDLTDPDLTIIPRLAAFHNLD